MTTAYSGEAGDGKLGLEKLDYLPYKAILPNNKQIEIAPFEESDWNRGMELMNLIIREGKTWPFVDEFHSVESYRGYFLSHSAFVVRSKDEDDLDKVMGCFYIKPNFPGEMHSLSLIGIVDSFLYAY